MPTASAHPSCPCSVFYSSAPTANSSAPLSTAHVTCPALGGFKHQDSPCKAAGAPCVPPREPCLCCSQICKPSWLGLIWPSLAGLCGRCKSGCIWFGKVHDTASAGAYWGYLVREQLSPVCLAGKRGGSLWLTTDAGTSACPPGSLPGSTRERGGKRPASSNQDFKRNQQQLLVS